MQIHLLSCLLDVWSRSLHQYLVVLGLPRRAGARLSHMLHPILSSKSMFPCFLSPHGKTCLLLTFFMHKSQICCKNRWMEPPPPLHHPHWVTLTDWTIHPSRAVCVTHLQCFPIAGLHTHKPTRCCKGFLLLRGR